MKEPHIITGISSLVMSPMSWVRPNEQLGRLWNRMQEAKKPIVKQSGMETFLYNDDGHNKYKYTSIRHSVFFCQFTTEQLLPPTYCYPCAFSVSTTTKLQSCLGGTRTLTHNWWPRGPCVRPEFSGRQTCSAMPTRVTFRCAKRLAKRIAQQTTLYCS